MSILHCVKGKRKGQVHSRSVQRLQDLLCLRGDGRPFSDTGPQGECGSMCFTHLEMQEQGLKAAQWHTCANLDRGGAWFLPETFLFHVLAPRFVPKLSKSVSLGWADTDSPGTRPSNSGGLRRSAFLR